MIKQGDCKTELKKIEQNSVDLIYFDPPFFTQKNNYKKQETIQENTLLMIIGKILNHTKIISKKD